MGNDVRLTFINNSSDADNSRIVIFQKPVNPDPDMHTIAWQVLPKIASGDSFTFTVPYDISIAAADAGWHQTPMAHSYPGQVFRVIQSGDNLELALTHNETDDEVHVRNDLENSPVTVRAYRDGKLLATKSYVKPKQTAAFKFPMSICIGVADTLEEGEVIDRATLDRINTELSLLGIESADIVMTGGGSEPFSFALENVEKE